MPEEQAENEKGPGKGASFFKRAAEVAATGNWDFAIEMYLQGIAREPGNVERGHQPLREAALKRKLQGGKGPSMMDNFRRRPGKDPLTNLLNAERLLAKDPGSEQFMERFLQAATKLDLRDVSLWMCDVLMESQRQAKTPSKRVLWALIRTYTGYEVYDKALQACQMAKEVSPDDAELQETYNHLAANDTIQKGKYDQEGDFTRSVKDLERQKELIQKDALVQTAEFLRDQIDKAREDYEKQPTLPGKINAYVDALLKLEDESYENEAVDVLAKAHKDTGAYQFKIRIGDIRIVQMRRRYRKLKEAGDTQAALKQAQDQLAFELQEYTERAANYPTDLAIKYELGRRQFLTGKYDDAIGALQQAQRDPRRHLSALNYLGQAFAAKGWLKEAAETYQRALEGDLPESNEKDLRYSLGDVLFKLEQYKEARDQYSRVAQMDYNFKDVRNRIEAADKKLREAGQE